MGSMSILAAWAGSIRGLAAVALAIALVSCSKAGQSGNPVAVPPDTIPPIPGWTLVWHDEFDGPAIDTAKWNFEVNGDGGGNNELEYYTARPDNVYIDQGVLIICALQENYRGKAYTSARMNSNLKGDWKYGRFDIRARLPYGQGLWPAIWLLPTDWVYGGWPQSGEIDIMEMLGQETTRVYGTIHWGNPAHQHSGGSYVLPGGTGTFSGSYHLFTLEWDTTGMRWYVDGLLYHTEMHGQPFDQRFHMILNVAVGGDWPGSPDAATVFPQLMGVDYVRVYRKSN